MTDRETEDQARVLYNQNNAARMGAQAWDDLGDVMKRAFMSEARRLAEAEVTHPKRP